MIRVTLPHHLQTLAGCRGEVLLDVPRPVTQRSILDALESRHPNLRGTIRQHATLERRPRVRFYADGRDVSLDPPDAELAECIALGDKPFMIVGAVAGG